MKSIKLSDNDLSEVKEGNIIIKKVNDMLKIQIKEYTIGDEIADETEEDEWIFERDVRGRT
ncbi:hypothetical protein LCGC14_0407010 [marine sediment metagenome]|uniref:Uncharacterized protein n=1 Tax=marine sediment metagenome TaxID=412755 RepID=A0A0F9VH72_9ZZZZ